MPTFKSSILDQLNSVPPFLAFAMARKSRGKRPRLDELAKSAGMPERTFVRIARKFSWNGVKAAQIDAFCKACGVDILRQKHLRAFLRHTLKFKRPMLHLSDHQLRIFEKQCEMWREMQALNEKFQAEQQATQPQPEQRSQCAATMNQPQEPQSQLATVP